MRNLNSGEKGRLTSEQRVERVKLYDMYVTHCSQEALKWFREEPYYFKYRRMLEEIKIKKC